MGDRTTSELEAVLAFETALDQRVCDEVRREIWGATCLTPSLPQVWDLSWVEFERTGLPFAEVVAIADEVLGGAGFGHRTVTLMDEGDGTRLAAELAADPARWPGWEAELIRYMVWRGGEGDLAATGATAARADGDVSRAPTGATETTLARIEGLRRDLIVEDLGSAQGSDEVVDQLLEMSRRAAAAAGDRWFVAPDEEDPASACCLYRGDGIAQVEDVATLLDSRERGYAKAVVTAAIEAARDAGDPTIFLIADAADPTIFLIADAADWPQLMYAKLGFEAIGDRTILRRTP